MAGADARRSLVHADGRGGRLGRLLRRQPVTVGSRLSITGRVLDQARRSLKVRAEIHRMDEPTELVADMDAMMVLTDVEQWQHAQPPAGASIR